MGSDVRAIVFDLGNVLVSIDFNKVFEAWSRVSGQAAEHFRSRFSMDAPYREHECGRITGEKYFAHLESVFQVTLTRNQWEEGWNAVFLDEISLLRPLVKELKKKFPLYVLSNTNQAHRAFWSAKYAPLLADFDRVFTSDQLGCRKPDSEAYFLVCREIECSPSQVLFFDDTFENVQGARSAGLEAIHVQSISDIATSLAGVIGRG